LQNIKNDSLRSGDGSGFNENGLDVERFVEILNMNKLFLPLGIFFLVIGFFGIFFFTPQFDKTLCALIFIGGSIILSGVLISNAIRESRKE
jgi:hypothetical protein